MYALCSVCVIYAKSSGRSAVCFCAADVAVAFAASVAVPAAGGTLVSWLERSMVLLLLLLFSPHSAAIQFHFGRLEYHSHRLTVCVQCVPELTRSVCWLYTETRYEWVFVRVRRVSRAGRKIGTKPILLSRKHPLLFF